METRDSNSLRRELSAFVDGELDAAAAQRLQTRLSSDAEAAEVLRRIEQLTAAARRALRRPVPPPSDSLIEKLRDLAGSDAPPERPSRSSRNVMLALGWAILPRAAAAILLLAVGIWVGHRVLPSNQIVRQAPDGSVVADVLPAAVIAQAEEIHGFCSRLADGLHTAGYPKEISPLAESVENDLHSSHPYPDLGSIGFRYRGAGPCGKPLPETAHLLYKSVRPGSYKAISVFVQPWKGQYPLDKGRLYTVSVATSPFPMLAWRTESVVYFLLADDLDTVEKVAALIRGTHANELPAPSTTAPDNS